MDDLTSFERLLDRYRNAVRYDSTHDEPLARAAVLAAFRRAAHVAYSEGYTAALRPEPSSEDTNRLADSLVAQFRPDEAWLRRKLEVADDLGLTAGSPEPSADEERAAFDKWWLREYHAGHSGEQAAWQARAALPRAPVEKSLAQQLRDRGFKPPPENVEPKCKTCGGTKEIRLDISCPDCAEPRAGVVE